MTIKPKKAVNHRRYATQQLNDRFQQIPYPGIGYLRHIDCHRQTKRQCKKDGKQTDPQRPRNERQKAELRSRCCRGKPFSTGKDVLHRDGVVFQQMHRVRTNDELLRYEGYNARRTLHQLRNASTCIFIGSAQLLFRIILCDVLQTEKADRKVLPPTSFQFVSSSSKTSFICAGVSSLTRFSLFKANTYPSSITLLLNKPSASEKRNTTISTMVRLVTKPLQASIPSTIFSKIFFHVAY